MDALPNGPPGHDQIWKIPRATIKKQNNQNQAYAVGGTLGSQAPALWIKVPPQN